MLLNIDVIYSKVCLVSIHYSGVTWAPWRLTSPATQMFIQQLYQTIKKNTKTPNYELLALCERNPPVTSGFPSQRDSHVKSFHVMAQSQCEKISQFAMLETSENWFGLVNSCVCFARQARKIHQVLSYSVDFKAPGELWNPLSKTVHGKFSFIWNRRPANILNGRKAQR